MEINVHGAGLEWDSSISYEHPALVTGSDALLYVSVQDSTNVDPVTDSGESHWKLTEYVAPQCLRHGARHRRTRYRC